MPPRSARARRLKVAAIAKNIYSSAQQQPNDVDAQSEHTQPPMYAHSQPPTYAHSQRPISEHAQSSEATDSAGSSSTRRSRANHDMNKAWIVDVIERAREQEERAREPEERAREKVKQAQMHQTVKYLVKKMGIQIPTEVAHVSEPPLSQVMHIVN
ncbi:uncharacterized protein G2W53_033327 [Senna tora]|uniref:Uncharacterized protein n=1 Tax=Senna tora TaxID=362788 RepID=A0A834SZ28_9FABA|nr:uncharacterized protein G2W53_033327 [Senna tora]